MAQEATRDAARTGVARLRSPWLGLLVMATLYLALASSSLRHKSVTVDEFGHLPAGYHLLTSGDFGYCTLNPPGMNALSALPLLWLELRGEGVVGPLGQEPGYDFWLNGYAFMDRHRADYVRAFTLARHVTVVVVGLLGLLGFVWARALVPERGAAAGLMAAGLIWFSPGVLAHARLVTTDAACAASMALATAAAWWALRRPGALRAAACGVAIGLALLTKFTAVYLYLLLPVQALWLARGRPELPLRRLGAGVALAFAVSGATICAGYLCRDVGRPLGEFALFSAPGRALSAVLPDSMPVPLPSRFVAAFDRQLHATQRGEQAYLLGEQYEGRRWEYYAVITAAKTPLPLILLALWAATAGARQAASRRDAVLLLVPGAVLLVAFSCFSAKQLGVRQILPAAPLFWIWVACALARAGWSRRGFAALAALGVWLALVHVRVYPDYLATFNALAGGPDGGRRVALDSNLDWGQDLVALRRHLDAAGAGRIQLLYFGRVDPALYGIDYVVGLESGRVPELIAVSLSLHGRSYFAYDHGALRPIGPIPWDEPALGREIATLGHSIRVFRRSPPSPLP